MSKKTKAEEEYGFFDEDIERVDDPFDKFFIKSAKENIMKTGTLVANVTIDYRFPIHIKDRPQVYVKCVHIGNTSFLLEHVIMGENEAGEVKIFALASTTMVSVDMADMRPVPVPEVYAVKMRNKT
jgi:acyl-CoA thioester hydrolase